MAKSYHIKMRSLPELRTYQMAMEGKSYAVGSSNTVWKTVKCGQGLMAGRDLRIALFYASMLFWSLTFLLLLLRRWDPEEPMLAIYVH